MPRLSFFSEEVWSEGEDTHTEFAEDHQMMYLILPMWSQKNLSRMVGQLICQAQRREKSVGKRSKKRKLGQNRLLLLFIRGDMYVITKIDIIATHFL